MKWSQKITEKVKYSARPPKGTFTKKANEIVNILMKQTRNPQKALKKLIFYMNRAGKNLTNSLQLNRAKSLLSNMTKLKLVAGTISSQDYIIKKKISEDFLLFTHKGVIIYGFFENDLLDLYDSTDKYLGSINLESLKFRDSIELLIELLIKHYKFDTAKYIHSNA